MSEHTPGPWKAEKDPLCGSRSWRIGRDGCAPVMVLGAYSDHVHPEEEAANARLVAAAPDLLAACRVMQEAFRHDCEKGFMLSLRAEMFNAVKMVDVAIARAEGKP